MVACTKWLRGLVGTERVDEAAEQCGPIGEAVDEDVFVVPVRATADCAQSVQSWYAEGGRLVSVRPAAHGKSLQATARTSMINRPAAGTVLAVVPAPMMVGVKPTPGGEVSATISGMLATKCATKASVTIQRLSRDHHSRLVATDRKLPSG